MINANELRIGNWINYLDINGVNPAQIEIDDFINLKEDGEKDFPFTPIPLTPEILEKCGFVMHKTSQLWRKDNFYLHHYLVSDNEYCFKYSDFTSSSIQYLHQLQNLYFALCGEELNYTP